MCRHTDRVEANDALMELCTMRHLALFLPHTTTSPAHNPLCCSHSPHVPHTCFFQLAHSHGKRHFYYYYHYLFLSTSPPTVAATTCTTLTCF